MKPPSHDASARQHSGEPFSGRSANDARRDRPHNQDLAEVDGEIARLVDRSTEELRRAWRGSLLIQAIAEGVTQLEARRSRPPMISTGLGTSAGSAER